MLCEPDGVGRDHPLSMEKLSPILAYYVVDGLEEGCQRCAQILRYGGMGHTRLDPHREPGCGRVITEFECPRRA